MLLNAFHRAPREVPVVECVILQPVRIKACAFKRVASGLLRVWRLRVRPDRELRDRKQESQDRDPDCPLLDLRASRSRDRTRAAELRPLEREKLQPPSGWRIVISDKQYQCFRTDFQRAFNSVGDQKATTMCSKKSLCLEKQKLFYARNIFKYPRHFTLLHMEQ